MSKLSDIFRRASRGLSSKEDERIGEAFDAEFKRVERRCLRTKEERRAFDKLYEEGTKIISQFKPKYAREHQGWFIVWGNVLSHSGVAKNAYVCESIEEAQAKRKEILLKCAQIAESEGL